MKRNDELLFRINPKGAAIKSDSHFLRDMGIVAGEMVCEISYQDKPWLVSYNDIKTPEQVKQGWRNEIVKLKPLHKTKKALAAALNIDVRILNKRIALCDGVTML